VPRTQRSTTPAMRSIVRCGALLSRGPRSYSVPVRVPALRRTAEEALRRVRDTRAVDAEVCLRDK